MIRYLGQSPAIGIASTKEVHYFDWHHERGENWYRSWFPLPTAGRPVIVGESSPSYLMNPLVPERVAASLPDAKLVVLLRNPADRAISHFQYRRNRGMEKTETLAIALKEEPDRVARRGQDEGQSWGRLDCYFDQGSYVKGLQRWLKLYDRDRLHIVKSEDLFVDAEDAYSKVLDFLGIERGSQADYAVHNSAKYEGEEPGLRAELIERYQPLNEELYELIGRDMEWS